MLVSYSFDHLRNRQLLARTAAAGRRERKLKMYKSIAAATDWYFAQKPERPTYDRIVWNLAAWGLKQNGEIVGLVSVTEGGKPKLVAIPDLEGMYLHKSQLSPAEVVATVTL